MEQLKVIGIEEGVLVLATESGDRFSLAVDESLRAQLRRQQRATEPRAARPSPREIQTHIRAGLPAEQVAELLNIRIEDVARYEGPVLAEREHVVGQALAVPVLIGGELDPDAQPTFGNAVRSKLAEAGATGERWSSWREEATGWVVKLEFTANDVDHDARWAFDPRRSTLSPQNSDAVQLSRQGSLPEGLIPRLRALDAQPVKDSSRFDSGAFGPRRLPEPETETEVDAAPAPETNGEQVVRDSSAAQEAAMNRAPDATSTSPETADLLEALRRRRGQREPMPEEGATPASHAPVALFDALEPDDSPRGEQPSQASEQPSAERGGDQPADNGRRKGRTSMPSWDEIVFGARTEDG